MTLDLSFEPPEPPPHREWPDYVRLTYGHVPGLPDDLADENEKAYPLGYLGWMIRMGYHLTSLIDERTTRISDEAVLAAALLHDLQTERRRHRERPEAVELLDELQGRLLAQLRRHSLPTGVGVYRPEEAAAVLDRWSSRVDSSRTNGDFVLSEYLALIREVLESRGTPQMLRRQTPIETLPGEEAQARVAAELRALAAQVEGGALQVQEVQSVRRGGWLEVQLRGQVSERRAPVMTGWPCPECI